MTNNAPSLQAAELAAERDPVEGDRMLAAIVASDSPERPAAALALVRLRVLEDSPDSYPDHVDLLEVALTAEEHAIVADAHLRLGYALRDVDPTRAEAHLRAALVDPELDTSMEAAQFLAELVEGPEREALLQRALGHTDGVVRSEAALALAEDLVELDPDRARALALAALDDGEGEDRARARAIPEQLGDAL